MHVPSWPITCCAARQKAIAEMPRCAPREDRPCSSETGHTGGNGPKSLGALLISRPENRRMYVVAVSTPFSPEWRRRIVDYSGQMVDGSDGTLPSMPPRSLREYPCLRTR